MAPRSAVPAIKTLFLRVQNRPIASFLRTP
jgi:hypothetical protein